MKEDVGLVHQMPYTCDSVGLPSTLEKVYFGTYHARMYLSAAVVGINCATGMSALMRKNLLDKAGGFQAFGCYLAEDFFFAKHITDENYKLASLSAHILFKIDPVPFYMVHILVWFMFDWILIHVVQNGNLPFNKFEFLVMWMFRECGAPYLFLHAVMNQDISWRTKKFRWQNLILKNCTNFPTF